MTTTPTHTDVLLGRGVATDRHPGNENFRAIISQHVNIYVVSTKKQKMMISRSIVEKVKTKLDPPGRFLEKDANSKDSNSSSKTGSTSLWHEVADKQALEKTAQALRDGAAPLRKQLSEEMSDPAFMDALFDGSAGKKQGGSGGGGGKSSLSRSLTHKVNTKASSLKKKKHRRTKSTPISADDLSTSSTTPSKSSSHSDINSHHDNQCGPHPKKQRSNPEMSGRGNSSSSVNKSIQFMELVDKRNKLFTADVNGSMFNEQQHQQSQGPINNQATTSQQKHLIQQQQQQQVSSFPGQNNSTLPPFVLSTQQHQGSNNHQLLSQNQFSSTTNTIRWSTLSEPTSQEGNCISSSSNDSLSLMKALAFRRPVNTPSNTKATPTLALPKPSLSAAAMMQQQLQQQQQAPHPQALTLGGGGWQNNSLNNNNTNGFNCNPQALMSLNFFPAPLKPVDEESSTATSMEGINGTLKYHHAPSSLGLGTCTLKSSNHPPQASQAQGTTEYPIMSLKNQEPHSNSGSSSASWGNDDYLKMAVMQYCGNNNNNNNKNSSTSTSISISPTTTAMMATTGGTANNAHNVTVTSSQVGAQAPMTMKPTAGMMPDGEKEFAQEMGSDEHFLGLCGSDPFSDHDFDEDFKFDEGKRDGG